MYRGFTIQPLLDEDATKEDLTKLLNAGVWTRLQTHDLRANTFGGAAASACPFVVIMDGQSVKTTERLEREDARE